VQYDRRLERNSYSPNMDSAHARIPKQTRSRQSFELMLEAAHEILSQEGLAALTLAEVSRRSGVSIGSIYCRVAGKEDLLRALQARVLEQMDVEFAGAVNKLRRKSLSLRELVPALVRELANFHRRHAPALAAFIELGNTDDVIEKVGKTHYAQIALDFRLLLLERRHEFIHRDPERAADICFTVIYGTLARFLGLSGAADAVSEREWKRLLEELGLMAMAYLVSDLSPLKPSAESDRKS
jgi:AcrR family transcriptional regulator